MVWNPRGLEAVAGGNWIDLKVMHSNRMNKCWNWPPTGQPHTTTHYIPYISLNHTHIERKIPNEWMP